MIPSSKWSLHKFFSRSPVIRSYLPPTSLYQRSSLTEYLNKYQCVYVKPSNKHMGQGILKVWKTEDGYRFVKERGKSVNASTIDELYQEINRHSVSARYVIQKGIDLAEVNGRPFDIRVMMMRNGRGSWQYAGMLAKVAGAGSIITNVARGGGYVMKVSQALKQSKSIEPNRIRTVIRDMIRLSYQVCRHFNKYKYSSQIGIDYAVDKKGRLSIIEVNFDFPSHGLFAKLPDKTYFRTIKRLANQYRLRVRRRKKR
jgi:hypothetical protein